MPEEIFTEEQWVNIWKAAGALKLAGGAAPDATWMIKGRWITVIYNKLCQFWSDHKATLIPVLSQLAIATLEAVLTARANVNQVNAPGPH